MPTSYGHTVKAFDEDLDQLRVLISEMGARAEAAITDAMRALTKRDQEAAERVVEGDHRIDELEAEVERLVVRLIALRAPMADDLREVIAALKISTVVERMGDYAKNIARRVPQIEDGGRIEPISVLPAMARAVTTMVRGALDAFVARDAQAAVAVWESDREVDDFYNSLFRALLTHMMENPHTITTSAHLLFVARNLERIGDHATNVAETVYYAATGHYLAERKKADELGDNN